MPDLSNFEIAQAFREPGCPLCRVLAADEEREMQQFWRDSRLLPLVRRSFLDNGGFCPRHAWLLHEQVTRAGRGGALTDLYEALAARDQGRIERLVASSEGNPEAFARQLHEFIHASGCFACQELEAATERRSHFARQLLQEEGMFEAYVRSDGFCYRHLGGVLVDAGEHAPALASALLRDWNERLSRLRHELAEFEWKRDYRRANEPRGVEQEAPTHAVSRYAGEQPDNPKERS